MTGSADAQHLAAPSPRTPPWRRRGPGQSEPPIAGGTESEQVRRARATLLAWQDAGFRGHLTVEALAERHMIVRVLQDAIVQFHGIAGIVIAADDQSLARWQPIVGQSEGWHAVTAEEVLLGAIHLNSNVLVVADEVENYLTATFAGAVNHAGGFLGLCAAPRGLQDSHRLRRAVGNPLQPTAANGVLDLSSLDIPQDREDFSEVEPRERLIHVADPESLLGFYLSEAQRIPLLSPQEETELAKAIEVGLYAQELIANSPGVPILNRPPDSALNELAAKGMLARDRFITSNLRLVYAISRQYSRQMEIMDIVQEGNLGLIHAVMKFDYRKGYKFSTYATWWIRQAISRAIADKKHLIRLPAHVHESDSRILSEFRALGSLLDSGTAAEIADSLGISPSAVDAALRRHRPPLSLEVLQDAGFEFVDPDEQDFTLERVLLPEFRDALEDVLNTLTEREAGVIRMRFGLSDGRPQTLDQIGRVYGVTRERIRQIESKTMSKLRHPRRSQVLRDYLEIFE